MKKIIFIITLFFLCINKVSASYIVMDQDNNKILYGDNIHEKRLIASITKVMTAYIVINNAKLDETIVVGDEVNLSHGSSIYLKKGEEIKVIDLLYGMMLRSGNDAATVLAIHTAGSLDKFVKLMNEEVNKMGLKDTIFQNPTGLDDEETKNISSAYDMAYITSKAMKNMTFKKIFSTKKYSVKTNLNVHVWQNKNKALFIDKNITGGKTGYTKKAKRTLITTSSKDNMNLVIVSLGISDDFNFHINFYNSIYSKYSNYLILNKNKLNIKDKYYKSVRFYLKDNYHLILTKKDLKNIFITYELYKYKNINSGDIVGRVRVFNKNREIYNAPIYVIVL
ncbi:MAG: D-alanyl-D-alanine carboxypeptidase [Bacilli bacterium]|nr:D-alanyl-D-alanine carboxypeptidase [Bacilli bacterium]